VKSEKTLIDFLKIIETFKSEIGCFECLQTNVSFFSKCGHLALCRSCFEDEWRIKCPICNDIVYLIQSEYELLNDDSDVLCRWCFSRLSNCGLLSDEFHACYSCLRHQKTCTGEIIRVSWTYPLPQSSRRKF
jgi:hypothetical protein